MSKNEMVEVPFEGEASDRAVLLLEAAEKAGLDQSVVRTRDGGFYVPAEVASAAGFGEDGEKKAPKKRAAKKAPAKKAAAKKAAPKPAADSAGDDDKAQE